MIGANMRKVTQSEQERKEIEAAERAEKRSHGFELMAVRDRGWFKLSNGVGIMWHSDEPLADWEARRYVPDGMFLLNFDGKEAIFDKEEFMRYLRWA